MDDILATRSEWSSRTIVRPLRSAQELQKLGLELSSARQEWTSPTPTNPVAFGDKLRAEVSRKQVWLWIWRKRLWRLGIPSAGSTFTLAALTFVALVPYTHSKFPTIILLVTLALLWGAVLYSMSFFVARRDLVMTNRYIALEQKQLNDCDQLIERIKELHKIQGNGPFLDRRDRSSLVVRIGRWDLQRRPRPS